MIEVAAVIVRDETGRILICRRGAGGHCAYLWEFPGGKREAGESLADCAVRECREELGVTVTLGELYDRSQYTYPDKALAFSFFTGRVADGTPALHVHSGMCWVRPDELAGFSFCPADTALVQRLMREADAGVPCREGDLLSGCDQGRTRTI